MFYDRLSVQHTSVRFTHQSGNIFPTSLLLRQLRDSLECCSHISWFLRQSTVMTWAMRELPLTHASWWDNWRPQSCQKSIYFSLTASLSIKHSHAPQTHKLFVFHLQLRQFAYKSFICKAQFHLKLSHLRWKQMGKKTTCCTKGFPTC